MRYEREGYCCRCGECCASGDYQTSKPIPCVDLIKDADGKFACRNHGKANTYWHRACMTWPQKPQQIKDYPSCTYWFREVPD